MKIQITENDIKNIVEESIKRIIEGTMHRTIDGEQYDDEDGDYGEYDKPLRYRMMNPNDPNYDDRWDKSEDDE